MASNRDLGDSSERGEVSDAPESPGTQGARSAPGGSVSRFVLRGEPDEPIDDDSDGPAPSLTRVRVEDAGVVRPFMRGILVHSLTERGMAFEDAYEVAQHVWSEVRGRARVTKSELRQIVAKHLAGSPDPPPDPTAGAQAGVTPPTIQVIGKDGRWPFNQARLQQSMLAAGLKPLQAFEVAVEIENELLARRHESVERDVIRDLAANHLRERFSKDFAHRYLAWRSFQREDERPLILLLGGTSGVGKSSLALEVARRLGIGRVLSTDSIRDVMRVMLSDDLVPTLHVSSFEAHSRLTRPVQDGADPVVEGFLEQSRTVSVGVRAVIERAIAEGTSTVIDGVSIVPGFFDAGEWQDRAHVFFLLAADEDRESLHSHLVARAHGRGARASERYVRNFREIFTIQEDLLERARLNAVPVVDVQHLEGAARRVVTHVVGHLGERRAAEGAGAG